MYTDYTENCRKRGKKIALPPRELISITWRQARLLT
jgi:hypothetical protein